MAVRKKRSISMPPDLDSTIEAAARAEGVSNSGWPTEVARKEFTVRAGLDAVTGFERAHGRFTRGGDDRGGDLASEALARSKRTGGA